MSSVEYPRGNAINESSHRLLEVAIRTLPMSGSLSFNKLVSKATLLYNIIPHSALGDTPSSFNVRRLISEFSVLSQYESLVDEAARLSIIVTFRGVHALQNQL